MYILKLREHTVFARLKAKVHKPKSQKVQDSLPCATSLLFFFLFFISGFVGLVSALFRPSLPPGFYLLCLGCPLVYQYIPLNHPPQLCWLCAGVNSSQSCCLSKVEKKFLLSTLVLEKILINQRTSRSYSIIFQPYCNLSKCVPRLLSSHK